MAISLLATSVVSSKPNRADIKCSGAWQYNVAGEELPADAAATGALSEHKSVVPDRRNAIAVAVQITTHHTILTHSA